MRPKRVEKWTPEMKPDCYPTKRILANVETMNVETIQLPKGLTRAQAIKLCLHRWKHDHRGFTYNPKTGIAKAV
jgi:hypothetical protein